MKKYFLLPYTVFILFFLPALQLRSQCAITSGTSGTIGDAGMPNSVSYTCTVSGGGSFLMSNATTFCGFTFPACFAPWTGNTDALSYVTYNFSSQILGVDVFIAGAGAIGAVETETFVFTTNAAITAININHGSCAAWNVTGNIAVSPFVSSAKHAVVKVSSPYPFSSITIASGYNSKQNIGAQFGLCNMSMVSTSLDKNYISGLHYDIYPNPTANELHISIEGNNTYQLNGSASVYDLIGRRLLTKADFNTGECRISLSEIPAGVYMLELNLNGQSVQRKVIKE